MAFFSLSGRELDTAERMIQIEMGKPARECVWPKSDAECPQLDASNYVFQTISDQTIDTLKLMMLVARSYSGCRLFCIDCLQDLKSELGRYSDVTETRKLVYRLRDLTKELDAHIMILSQSEASPYPDFHETAETPYWFHRGDGQVCNEVADVFLHLIRPEYYNVLVDENGNDLHDVMDIHVLKNRNGQTGKVRLKFNKKIGRLEGPVTTEENIIADNNRQKSTLHKEDNLPF